MVGKVVLYGVVGACLGLFLSALSFGMTAAGHGWMSALVGLISVVTAPAAAAAWPLRGTRAGSTLAGTVLVVGLAADVWVVVATQREGVDYMTRMGGASILWWVLFASWQLAAGAAVLKRDGKQAA